MFCCKDRGHYCNITVNHASTYVKLFDMYYYVYLHDEMIWLSLISRHNTIFTVQAPISVDLKDG